MSAFSDCMGLSFDASKSVFGTVSVVINSVPVDVIEHLIDYANAIDNAKAGRQDVIDGTLVMSRAEWLRCGGRQGSRFDYNGLPVRVANDPLIAQAGDTVTLKITKA